MKLELKSNGIHTEKILIDGKELKRVSKIQVNMSGGKIPTATIEIIPDEIEVDGDFYFIKEKPLIDYSIEELTAAINDKIDSQIKGFKEYKIINDPAVQFRKV